MVSQTGAGFGSHVNLEACTRHKVAVAAGGTGTHSTCEITWGLIHCAMRSIPLEIRNLAGGGWQTRWGRTFLAKRSACIPTATSGAKWPPWEKPSA